MKVEVDDKSLRKLLKRVDNYPEKVQQGVTKEITRSAIRINSKARIKVPVKTGRLRSSIYFSILNKKSAKVATNVEYAADVENGHPARTVTVPAHTRISNKGTKHEVSSHTKRQPARKARPYLGPAAKEEFPKLVIRLKNVLKTA